MLLRSMRPCHRRRLVAFGVNDRLILGKSRLRCSGLRLNCWPASIYPLIIQRKNSEDARLILGKAASVLAAGLNYQCAQCKIICALRSASRKNAHIARRMSARELSAR